MDSITGLFKGEEENGLEQACESCKLTYTQRMIGFGVCFVLGWIISFASLFFLKNLSKFAIMYSIGSLTTIGSTFFLNGPVAQVKSMFAADRFIATLMYLGTLALTLGLALSGQPVGWVVAALILQVIAMCWYALSYIPYGREMCQRVACGCMR